MTTITYKPYIEKLKNLEKRMLKAIAFAKKLPLFKQKILDNIYTGEDDFINFGNKYKDIYFNWHIGRYLYSYKGSREISNYDGKTPYAEFLFKISLNEYQMFPPEYFARAVYSLNKFAEGIDCFFYDMINTTFYLTDEQIEPFLSAFREWYLTEKEKAKTYIKQEKKRRLLKEKEKIEKELQEINKENKQWQKSDKNKKKTAERRFST